jgi:hypothetical protein
MARLDYINLGLSDQLDRALQIHPNPASSHLTFFIPDQRIYKVQIYSYSGTLVLDKTLDLINEKVEIDIRNLPRGLHIIKAQTEAGSFQGKFIKQ